MRVVEKASLSPIVECTTLESIGARPVLLKRPEVGTAKWGLDVPGKTFVLTLAGCTGHCTDVFQGRTVFRTGFPWTPATALKRVPCV